MKKTFRTTLVRAIKPPADFARTLKANPPAWDRWQELSYSHQREHVEAIEAAKKPDTRARRIEKAVQALAARPSRPARPAKTAGATAVTRYALLLRGVNVGTKNSLPMAELRAMLTRIGCSDVQTYVQSGNAVFGTKLGEAQLTKAIEDALERYMGRPISTTLRTHEQLKAIIAAKPFGNVATSPTYLCVTFLSHAPTQSEVAPLGAHDFEPELFQVSGNEIYTWHPSGQGRSPLAAALGKLPLRGAVTTRNWNTVTKLTEMLGEG